MERTEYKSEVAEQVIRELPLYIVRAWSNLGIDEMIAAHYENGLPIDRAVEEVVSEVYDRTE